MSVVVADPKIEVVEYWHMVGTNGVSATYMLRVERGERANILCNHIDNSPLEVQLLLRHDDEKNEVAGTLSFPIANLFSYGKENGTFASYPKGHAPVDKAVEEDIQRRQESLVLRKRRVEAIMGQVSDLRDGPVPPTTT